ncbi:two-component sensor kinase [Candidatus Jettenia caeni]|uniref:histidine kinase n=1 Tax=Candidatus Jettenia caeni TaxID=247490 RepID=I3IPR6_9BACT|nr:ATP-binding protein [Candidatus Jettenia sp. AMX1]GAB63711.1 two-component sensor kinase [Candidatus Jettenia caeni]
MIKNSLWRRIIFGYIIITLFMLSTSFYLIFRLNFLKKVTDSVMKSDIPSIENGEKLIDSLLEQVRNEKKYLITNDQAFLNLFDKKKIDFFDRLQSLEEYITGEEKVLIHKIKEFYNKYIAIVSKEFILVGKDNIIPPDARYEEEKKNTLEQITKSINTIILSQQTALIKKIELLQIIVHKSTKVALSLILSAILFGTIFSYFFTRSICLPIKTLQEATERISQGDLDYRIAVSSTDEIGTLGTAFNQMCNRLKELDLLKSEFISSISHNLKTPLTAIREANELMLDKIAGQVSEPQIKLLNIIKESTHRLTLMINDILDISRVEAGLMRYNFQYSNIHDIIRKSIGELRFLAERKNISFQHINGTSIPEISLDHDKIAQVIDNIFSNAIKFTPSGGTVTIKVKEVNARSFSPGHGEKNQMNNVHSFIQVSISDTGIGIPVEYHEKVFDKFQQVDNKGKGCTKGTGLGLFIAKQIVFDHGGEIWVENNGEQKGTTFHFTLPLKYNYT